MATNLKDLSGNSLSELLNLYGRIQRLIESDFCHVSDYMPEKIKQDIGKAQKKAAAEYERRFDED